MTLYIEYTSVGSYCVKNPSALGPEFDGYMMDNLPLSKALAVMKYCMHTGIQLVISPSGV